MTVDLTEAQWILVLPEVVVERETGVRRLPIESISLMTLHSKALGPLENWLGILEGEAGLGYNMFHFPPLQEYGFSDSLYSLKDHNEIADYYFKLGDPGTGGKMLDEVHLERGEKLEELGKVIGMVHG